MVGKKEKVISVRRLALVAEQLLAHSCGSGQKQSEEVTSLPGNNEHSESTVYDGVFGLHL